MPSILVVTTVHHPEDSRIRNRQIQALLDSGWCVTYAAPFTAYDVSPQSVDGLTTISLPRSQGRHRLVAWLAARRLLRTHSRSADVILVHDPEILTAAVFLGLDNLVWDVHEDVAASLTVKEWIPWSFRWPAARAWRRFEHWAESRWPLLLAEHAYQNRFEQEHAVVANTVRVPESVEPPGRDRVVYLGTVTVARGLETMIEVARLLRERTDDECRVEVIGPAADSTSSRLLRRAHADGTLRWHGFVPSAEALPLLDGALAGLSLLENLPNYRGSMPTKVVEYMAHGVPTVTTPLPLPADLVRSSGSGFVVPFDDPGSVVDVLVRLREDREMREAMGRAGHERARSEYDWTTQSRSFVAELTALATVWPA